MLNQLNQQEGKALGLEDRTSEWSERGERCEGQEGFWSIVVEL